MISPDQKKGLGLLQFFAFLIFCIIFPACSNKKPLLEVASSPQRYDALESDTVAIQEESERNSMLQVAKRYEKRVHKKRGFHRVDAMSEDRDASLIDFPLPLGSFPIEEYRDIQDDSDGFVYGYLSVREEDSLQIFFARELASFGWLLVTQIDGAERILLFEKPTKYCVISIRHSKNNKRNYRSLFTIAVGTRFSEPSEESVF